MNTETAPASASRILDPLPAYGVWSPVLVPFAEDLQRCFVQRPDLAGSPHS